MLIQISGLSPAVKFEIINGRVNILQELTEHKTSVNLRNPARHLRRIKPLQSIGTYRCNRSTLWTEYHYRRGCINGGIGIQGVTRDEKT